MLVQELMSKRTARTITLDRLDGRTRAAIERALTLGSEPLTAIAKRLKVCVPTVLAVRNASATDAQPWQAMTAANLRKFVHASSARLASEVDELSTGQLPVAMAICIDKLSQLEAAAGGPITAKPADVSPEKLLAALQALAARPAVAVQVNLGGEGVSSPEPSDQLMGQSQDLPDKKTESVLVKKDDLSEAETHQLPNRDASGTGERPEAK